MPKKVQNNRGFHEFTRVRLWGIFDFGGKFGPPEADEVKKCAQTYVKKPNMRANAHEIYMAGPKMNAD
jgi:hypothetical protein